MGMEDISSHSLCIHGQLAPVASCRIGFSVILTKKVAFRSSTHGCSNYRPEGLILTEVAGIAQG